MTIMTPMLAMNLRALNRSLASLIGMPAHELADLERVLRDEGLLEAGKPGPGGGTEATPQTATTLILAILAADSHRKAARSVPTYLSLPIFGEKCCRLTGACTFGDAIRRALESLSIAAGVEKLEVFRSEEIAFIDFKRPDGVGGSTRFGEGIETGNLYLSDDLHLSVRAQLSGTVIKKIADLLNGALSQEGETNSK